MPNRFVILHHQLRGGEHWDLMLEYGEILATWQLLTEPVGGSVLPIPAKRIGDHRKAYLAYEGPVSGDRGQVRRVDSGTVDIVDFSDDRCLFVLRGGRLSGRFRLQREGAEWTFIDAKPNP